jgi:hypothetical protein
VKIYNERAKDLRMPLVDEASARAIASAALEKIRRTTREGMENDDLGSYR